MLINRYFRNPENDSFEANVDGSRTPVEFIVKPRGGEREIFVNRVIITIGSSKNFSSGKYGQNLTLRNGILFSICRCDGTVYSDLLDGQTIQKNVDWASNCHDMNVHDFGSGEAYITARWSFDRGGSPIVLNKDRILKITIRDDLRKLPTHKFKVQGNIEG